MIIDDSEEETNRADILDIEGAESKVRLVEEKASRLTEHIILGRRQCHMILGSKDVGWG